MAPDDGSPRQTMTNSIEAPPAAGRTLSGAEQQPAPLEQGQEQHGRARANGRAAPYLSEPPPIADRYYVEDRGAERHYYDDYQRKALAITASETRIGTGREDLRTIRDMLLLAEARGWQSVDVKGSAAFRREAWIEASARGVEASGYMPNDLDRQEADRRRSERTPAASRRETPASAAPTTSEHLSTVRTATAELSQDGRLILSALSEKIDRQMSQQSSRVKAELKAFAATELVKKERAEGPVILSADQRALATAPDREGRAAEPVPQHRAEPPQPRLSRTR